MLSDSQPQAPTGSDSRRFPAADSMLERSVAGIIRFCGQAALTWGMLLLRPRDFIDLMQGRDSRIASPWSFLVVSLAAAGIGARTWIAQESVMPGLAGSVSADLMLALKGLSLWDVMLMTFPCVLMVAVLGSLLSELAGCRQRMDASPIVRATCYAAGFQFLLLGLLALGHVTIQTLLEDSELLSHQIEERIIGGYLLFAIVWSAQIIGRAIVVAGQRRLTTNWPVRMALGVVVSAVMLACGLLAMDTTFDFHRAKLARNALWNREWFGDLHVAMLESRHDPVMSDRPTRVSVTYLLTNQSDRRIVIPPIREWQAVDDECRLPIIASSLQSDHAPALILEAGQTRAAEFEFDVPALYSDALFEVPWPKFVLNYRRADETYAFESMTTNISLPCPKRPESEFGAIPFIGGSLNQGLPASAGDASLSPLRR